jgi:hypothetical protein
MWRKSETNSLELPISFQEQAGTGALDYECQSYRITKLTTSQSSEEETRCIIQTQESKLTYKFDLMK